MTDISVFKKFLDSKDPSTPYDFRDCDGACLIGQFMASQGEGWSMAKYSQHASTEVNGTRLGFIALGKYANDIMDGVTEEVIAGWTFGKAKERLEKALEEVA